MPLVLHVWNRASGDYERRDVEGVEFLKDAWGRKVGRDCVGIVALGDEPTPACPAPALTRFRRILATPAVGTLHGKRLKLERDAGHLGSHLLPVIGFPGRPEILDRTAARHREKVQAMRKAKPLVDDRFPDWFSPTPLAGLLPDETAAALAAHGHGDVASLSLVTKGTAEGYGLGDAEAVAEIRWLLREAYKAAVEARDREPVRTQVTFLPPSKASWAEVAAGDDGEPAPLPRAGAVDPGRMGSLRRSVEDSLAQFPERTVALLSGRLGLDGPPRTLKAMADELGVSTARAQQVESAALDLLGETHDWMHFVRALIERRAPVALGDLRDEPWASGLGTPSLSRLARVSCTRRLHVVRVAGREVIGDLSPTAWAAAARRVRDKLATVPFKLNETGMRAICALAMRPEERPYMEWMAREMLAGSQASRNRDRVVPMVASVRSMLETSCEAMSEPGIRMALSTHYGRTVDHDEVSKVLARFLPFSGGRRGLARHVLAEPDPNAYLRGLIERRMGSAVSGSVSVPDVMESLYKAWPAAATEALQDHVGRVILDAAAKAHVGKGSWDAVREETLRRMWGYGRSSREIAETLGTTRNAVIGKLNRLDLFGEQGALVDENTAPAPCGP